MLGGRRGLSEPGLRTTAVKHAETMPSLNKPFLKLELPVLRAYP